MHTRENYIPNLAALRLVSATKNQRPIKTFSELPIKSQHGMIRERFEKGAVDPISGAPLIDYSDLTAYMHVLRNRGAFPAMFPLMRQQPLDVNIVSNASNLMASMVAPGAPIKCSKADLQGVKLASKKAAGIAIFSKELVDIGGAALANMVRDSGGDALISAIDADVIPEMLNHSGTESFNSSGSTAENFRSDIKSMLNHVNVSGAGQLVFIASRTSANALMFDSIDLSGIEPQGGTLLNIPVLVSDGLEDDSAGGKLMLVDVSKLCGALETMEIETALEASLQMDTSPVDGAANMTSLFQHGLVAQKYIIDYGFEPLAQFKCAVLEGIN
jgi:hypothetical protein